ncbi:ATP-binding cassette domain-containing protein [Lolliginicoccus levis]|uniref:ATP-binding cassette domain-containing protein n=1 Tax=Lolliginicoccus levis TaxID=2919542 RepID=UPI00241E0FE9|nr:ATP-binding cassette domain-containing protein [Lolliginicoccus levis]
MDDARGDTAEPIISVADLSLRGSRGTVYGPHTFDIQEGDLAVIQSPPGTGRTALLLTLTARMRPSAGSATILGLPYPKRGHRIRKHTAIAGFRTIDDLDDSLTVRDALRERATWNSPWYRPVGRLGDADVEHACAPLFGDRPIPTGKTVLWDLSQLERLLLQISLSMMSSPRILAVDDLAQIEDSTERGFLVEQLAALTEHTTVLTTSADPVADHPAVLRLELAASRH